VFELEGWTEFEVVFVLEGCAGVGGGVGRVCAITGAGSDWPGTSFEEFVMSGAGVAELADAVEADDEECGAGAIHDLGVAVREDAVAVSAERPAGGAVAAYARLSRASSVDSCCGVDCTEFASFAAGFEPKAGEAGGESFCAVLVVAAFANEAD